MHITLLDEYENLEVFADYVLTNYITDEETGRVLFPVKLWNHFDNDQFFFYYLKFGCYFPLA